jgi:hypothetical protein
MACRIFFYALYLRIQVLYDLESEISLVIDFYFLVNKIVIIVLLVCNSLLSTLILVALELE